MPNSKPRDLAWLLLAATACGYGAVRLDDSRTVRLTVLAGTSEPQVAYVVESALREALNARGVRWARRAPDVDLQVRLDQVQVRLGSFAEPRLRAPRYEVVVRLDAAWRDRRLKASGTASFLTRPGELAALEGAYRQYLAEAARNAAEELVVAWILHFRGGG